MRTHDSVLSDWKDVVDNLLNIVADKLTAYGTERYDEAHSDEFNLWMCFSDVYRKILRLERLTRTAAMDSKGCGDLIKIKAAARKKLIDDYKDIANYAIMAVQILEEKKDVD